MSKREYCHTISQQYNCPRCLLIDLEQANEEIELLKADNTLKDLKITIQYDKIKKLEAKLSIAVERLERLVADGYANQIDKKALKEFKSKVGE